MTSSPSKHVQTFGVELLDVQGTGSVHSQLVKFVDTARRREVVRDHGGAVGVLVGSAKSEMSFALRYLLPYVVNAMPAPGDRTVVVAIVDATVCSAPRQGLAGPRQGLAGSLESVVQSFYENLVNVPELKLDPGYVPTSLLNIAFCLKRSIQDHSLELFLCIDEFPQWLPFGESEVMTFLRVLSKQDFLHPVVTFPALLGCTLLALPDNASIIVKDQS